MPADSRILIVNADDFGLSPGINAGIRRAHEHGIVTSASLMVRGAAAEEAVAYARSNRELSVGLHVDLGEWVWRAEEWTVAYQVVPPQDAHAVSDEVHAQLDRFRKLVGKDPTHLDSHQHVHITLEREAAKVFSLLADDLGVPLRRRTNGLTYCGDFYGQTEQGEPIPEAIGVGNLIRVIRALEPGATELCCHPGEGSDFDSSYRSEREREVATLCDPRVSEELKRERVELRSFAELA